MPARHLNTAVQLIRAAASEPSQPRQNDAQLLTAFLNDKDQIAFATIIQRHGPMVLRICRRILFDFHDAEDAFQATFILLAQHAAAIRKRESLASWLHGVGFRMARETRRVIARGRRLEEQSIQTKQVTDPAHTAIWREIQNILDEEIQALPAPYREPFVRHCLEQTSCAEVAIQLGLQEATVRKRLMRARRKLQEQLKQRGISLTAVLVGMAVSESTPPILANSLVDPVNLAALRVASGQPLAGTMPQNVIALIQGVSKAMFLTKMKATALFLATLAIVASGFGLAAQQVGKTPPGLDAAKSVDTPNLMLGKSNAFQIPAAMTAKLGIQIGEVRPRAALTPRVLKLTGTTVLDQEKLLRIRLLFTFCLVTEIGKAGEPSPIAGGDRTQELRPGDKVFKGQLLAVLHCEEAGQKKNELFDVILQLKLNEMILERAEKSAGAVPEAFILNAKKSVLTSLSAVTRAQHALKMCGIPESDIEAVSKEAREAAGKPKLDTEEQRTARFKEWSRVLLRAPSNGIIVERNLSVGEVVEKNTENLFTIANLDRLIVIADGYEEDLPSLIALEPKDRRWSVKLAAGGEASEGAIDEIGDLIDPKARTVVIKGHVDNKNNQLRVGQFVTASITLPVVSEMALAASAVVEQNGQNFVLVQRDANKPVFEQRRIAVARRGHDIVHIRTKLTPEQEKQGFHTIQTGERVVTTGAIELKAILDELKGQ